VIYIFCKLTQIIVETLQGRDFDDRSSTLCGEVCTVCVRVSACVCVCVGYVCVGCVCGVCVRLD